MLQVIQLPCHGLTTIRPGTLELETGIQFTDNTGQLEYSFGANATIQNSKIEKYDEPAYRFDYQFSYRQTR